MACSSARFTSLQGVLLLTKGLIHICTPSGDEGRPLPGLLPPSLLFFPCALLRLNDRTVDPVSDALGDRHELRPWELLHGEAGQLLIDRHQGLGLDLGRDGVARPPP